MQQVENKNIIFKHKKHTHEEKIGMCGLSEFQPPNNNKKKIIIFKYYTLFRTWVIINRAEQRIASDFTISGTFFLLYILF